MVDDEDEMPVGANGARPGAVAKKRTIRVGEVLAPRTKQGSRQKVPASKSFKSHDLNLCVSILVDKEEW